MTPRSQYRTVLLPLLLSCVMTVSGQSLLPKVWLDTAGTYINGVAEGPQWFKKGTTANNVRGMAFNPVTGHVLVATRDSAFNTIMVLNAGTGDTLGRLTMTGIGGGSAPFNRVAAARDGRIFTMNIQLSVTRNSRVRIYSWESETAAPVLVFNDSLQGPRIGDALSVAGVGAETYVYISGNASPGAVHILQWTGNALLLRRTVVPTGWDAGVLDIGPETDGIGPFWVNTTGKAAVKFDTLGQAVDTLGSEIVSPGASTVRPFMLGSRRFLVMNSGTSVPSVFRIIDITNGAKNAFVAGITPSLGSSSNPTGVGDIAFDGSDSSLYCLATNNGIGKYSITRSVPVAVMAGRRPYVPFNGQPDTILFSVFGLKEIRTAQLLYYGYRTSASDTRTIDTGSVPMTLIDGNRIQGVIPGTVNRNGRRVTCRAVVLDGAGVTGTTTEQFGYFAGVTRLTFKDGPRAVSPTGALLFSEYAIRSVGVVTRQDSITSPVDLDAVIQDSAGAAVIYNPRSNGGITMDLQRGERYSVEGRIASSNGLFQIREQSIGHPTPALTDLGPGTEPQPVLVTARMLRFDQRGEELENSLVAIGNLRPTLTSVSWPDSAPSSDAAVLTVTDNGIDSIGLRLSAFGDALNGQPILPPWSGVVGIIGQFDPVAPLTSGYQLVPRDRRDFTPRSLFPSMPVSFDQEDLIYSFQRLGGASAERVPNPLKAGVNQTSLAVRIVKNAGDSLAGIAIDLATPIQLPPRGLFVLAVLLPRTGMRIQLQLERTSDHRTTVPVVAKGTVANQWEDITFEASPGQDTTRYDRIILIPEPGVIGDGSAASTLLVDEFRLSSPPPSTLIPMWSRTAALGTMPVSLRSEDVGTGMAYGRVQDRDRLFIITNDEPPVIQIFDALSGDSVGILPFPLPRTGEFPTVRSISISDDGVIFAGTSTENAAEEHFRVYAWKSEKDTPTVVIDYDGAGLTGTVSLEGALSVHGSVADNSIRILAVPSKRPSVIQWSPADRGRSFRPAVISLSKGVASIDPSITSLSNGSFYLKSTDGPLQHFSASGELLDTIPSTIISRDIPVIKAFRRAGREWIIAYSPNDDDESSNEKFTVIDVTNPGIPTVSAFSPSIGTNANPLANGCVDVMMVDSNVVYFILGANNGMAAYTPDASFVVMQYDTLSYIDTLVQVSNPVGAGFVAGTNSFHDTGKYERFDLGMGDMIGAIRLFFSMKRVVGTPDTIQLVMKSVSSVKQGAPDSTFYMMPFVTTKIDTTASGNLFVLPTTVRVTGPVFIGLEWRSTVNDTFALFTDVDGMGQKAGRSWERYADGSYGDFGALTPSTYSWNLDVDIAIEAFYRRSPLTSVEAGQGSIPERFAIYQNFPNPFNPSTTIRFSIPSTAPVRLTIFDILGRKIRSLKNEMMPGGTHAADWDGTNDLGQSVSSGVFLYRIDSGSFIQTKKMLLLR